MAQLTMPRIRPLTLQRQVHNRSVQVGQQPHLEPNGWIFTLTVQTISSLGVQSSVVRRYNGLTMDFTKRQMNNLALCEKV